jgi:cation-transporting ATPase I
VASIATATLLHGTLKPLSQRLAGAGWLPAGAEAPGEAVPVPVPAAAALTAWLSGALSRLGLPVPGAGADVA